MHWKLMYKICECVACMRIAYISNDISQRNNMLSIQFAILYGTLLVCDFFQPLLHTVIVVFFLASILWIDSFLSETKASIHTQKQAHTLYMASYMRTIWFMIFFLKIELLWISKGLQCTLYMCICVHIVHHSNIDVMNFLAKLIFPLV